MGYCQTKDLVAHIIKEDVMDLLDTALECQNRGYLIVPVSGKEPSKWFKKNVKHYPDTNSEAEVRLWFTDKLVTGIGLRLDNMVALDIDTWRGELVGDLCDGAGAVIKGRGITSLWKLPAGVTFPKVNSKLTNCEVKWSKGAYVCIPPSWHEALQAPRTWQVGGGPWDACELPPPLKLQLDIEIAQDKEEAGEGKAPAETRHNYFYGITCNLCAAGETKPKVLAALIAANTALPNPIDEGRIEAGEFRDMIKDVFAKNTSITIDKLKSSFAERYQGHLLRVLPPAVEGKKTVDYWREYGGRCWEIMNESRLMACVSLSTRFDCTKAGRPDVRGLWAGKLLKWAPSIVALHVSSNKFDTVLAKLNCNNGTYSGGELQKHSPEDFITRCINIEYIPERLDELAESEWGKFLTSTCTKDGKLDNVLLKYLQLAAGYCVTGGNPRQIIFFVYGPPDTGKSTFLDTVRSVLGPYATAMRSEVLLRKQFQAQNTPELAVLEGKRFVQSSELTREAQLDESLLKSLTGDEEISATAKYMAPTTFTPEAVFWLPGNFLPRFHFEDLGVKKRVSVVPFTNVVAKADQKDLHHIFRGDEREREIILSWLVQGSIVGAGMTEFPAPKCVQKATAKYFALQDFFGQVLYEICEMDSEYWVTAKELYEALVVYYGKKGRGAPGMTAVGKKLTKLKFVKVNKTIRLPGETRGKLTRIWQGLRLCKPVCNNGNNR